MLWTSLWETVAFCSPFQRMLRDPKDKIGIEERTATSATRRNLMLGILCVAMALVALLPWWRNHDHVRDFYDYGLFINVNARLAEGQRPFVDFTTPAQSAAFILNYAAERIGGGTYRGMTGGAAALIILGVVGLSLMLARRMGVIAAGVVATAIVIGSASQHTILFYNPIGVLSLALVGWSFAVAPLLRRTDIGWHGLAAVGLFVGGINKVNFHLIACAMAIGWMAWAWKSQRASVKRVVATAIFVVFFGAVLPVATELAWTGTDWRNWYYNVVQLPLSARGGRISLLFSSALYFGTLHDYYGEIRLPQAGLFGVFMPLVAAIAAWRTGNRTDGRWRLVFMISAGVFSALAGVALLLTNNEISYVTFAASLVLTVGLWLGFRVEAKGGWFLLGVLIPALLLGSFGWESAWRGQRSQFGHSNESREDYRSGGDIGPDFAYLHGTFIPSVQTKSLSALADWRQTLAESDRKRIFYGPGVEWLEHIWPVNPVRGLPLVAAGFETERETALLEREVLQGKKFRYLLVVVAWDHWGVKAEQEMPRSFTKISIGRLFYAYEKLAPNTVWARPLEYNVAFGGNVDSSRLISTGELLQLEDGRGFLGSHSRVSEVEISAPSNRASGEAVLKRLVPASGEMEAVRFRVWAKNLEERYPRWSQDLVLEEGKDELIIPTDRLDASSRPLLFTVEIPGSMAGKVAAGWRALTLWDSIDGTNLPPLLQPGAAPANVAGAALRQAVLKDGFGDLPVFVRNAWMESGACRLSPGGEVWIHLTGIFTKIEVMAKEPGLSLANPRMKVVYYKGGRLETFHPAATQEAGTVRYAAWSPENGGWLGILADPDRAGPGCIVQIESAQPAVNGEKRRP